MDALGAVDDLRDVQVRGDRTEHVGLIAADLLLGTAKSDVNYRNERRDGFCARTTDYFRQLLSFSSFKSSSNTFWYLREVNPSDSLRLTQILAIPIFPLRRARGSQISFALTSSSHTSRAASCHGWHVGHPFSLHFD